MRDAEESPAGREWPCIWVSAGILAYRLCDRDFDCDHCPLHQALARSAERPVNLPLNWPRDRRYCSNHLWLRAEPDGRVRLGITAFAAELLQPVKAWQFPVPETSLPAFAPVATVETMAGSLPLLLPFAARLEEVNSRIGIDRLWPLADPWESGYLARVEPVESDALLKNCASLSEIGPQLVAHRHHLVGVAGSAGYFNSAGVRAADGGVPVNGWSRVLGRQRYKEVLGEIFLVAPI